ncbi:MAG: insulinase family protein [Clostridiales bacterium]|nr:insulinase family protein [Clostridiales bacterium]
MIKTVKLDCGAQVVLEKIPYVKSTCVGVWVKAGSVNENGKNFGISHFIEHMTFKGTPSRNAKQIAEDIDRIGGQINAFTGKEATCYYVKTLDSNIGKAVEVLLDIFFHSSYDDVEMEREKQVVYEEINMHDDSPEDDVSDTFYEALFNDHPLGTEILGTKEILASLTADDLRKYVDENYTMNNVLISVTGNFDEDEILGTFEKHFKQLSKKEQKKVIYPDKYEPKFIYKERDIEQAHICMGVRGAKLDDDLHYARHIVCGILGGSMSSRLFQSIREEKGMAYSVYSYLSSYTNDGCFTIYAGVGQDKLPETIRLIREELALLKDKGITADEFNAAKEQLKSSYTFSLENVSGKMASNGKSQLLLGKIYTPEETLDKISSVTMEEVEKVIKEFTDMNNYSASATGRNVVDLKELICG